MRSLVLTTPAAFNENNPSHDSVQLVWPVHVRTARTEAGNHGNMCASAVLLKFGLWGKSSVWVKPLKDPQCFPSTNTNASAASVAAHLGFEVNERWLWDWFKLSHAQNTYSVITNETQHNPTVICLT